MTYGKDHFEKLFSTYSSQFGNSWGMNWRAYMKLKNEKTLMELKNFLQKNPEGTYLETGCASGDFTECIIEDITAKGQYIGTDISETAVAICKDRFKDHLNTQFIVMALPNLPQGGLYDCIICMDVFEYFDDTVQKKCLKNIWKALKKNGIVILQVPLPAVDEGSLIQMVNSEFGADSIQTIAYAYGKWCAKWFENKLTYVATRLYRDRKLGWFGIPIGWIAYRICADESIIRFFFSINERFAPGTKSHLTIVAKK